GRWHSVGFARRRVATILPSPHTSESSCPLRVGMKCAQPPLYSNSLARLPRFRSRPAIMCAHHLLPVATHSEFPQHRAGPICIWAAHSPSFLICCCFVL